MLPPLPDRYEAQRLIGKGGQGATVLARDQETGEAVAVKVLTLGETSSWKDFELFERECKVLRSLKHPFIPKFRETVKDEDAGRFYLVMEYIEGESLGTGIAEARRYTDSELRTILDLLLEVLAYLHELNPPVFHRDIKPDNVVRKDDGMVYLVDFGGVRAAALAGTTTTVVGSFGYMAPEQMRGQASAATDLYSLGATIAAVASGVDASKLPTAGLEIDVTQTMKSGRTRDAVQAMLRPDPRDRVKTVGEVRAILDAPRAPRPTALQRREDAVIVHQNAEHWINRPLLRSPQFMGTVTAIACGFAVATGSIAVGLGVGALLVAIGLTMVSSVRRGFNSPD